LQNQKAGKLTLNNIIIGVNNKEILVEKLKKDILEQKNEYKISEYVIIEPFLLKKTIENALSKQDSNIYREIEENIINIEYDYNSKILENLETIRVNISSEKSIHEYLREHAISNDKNEITIFDEKDKQEHLLNNSIDIGIYLRKYVKTLAEMLEIKEAINQTETLKIKLESEYNYSRRR